MKEIELDALIEFTFLLYSTEMGLYILYIMSSQKGLSFLAATTCLVSGSIPANAANTGYLLG